MAKIIKLSDYRKKPDLPEDIAEIVHDLLRWDIGKQITKKE